MSSKHIELVLQSSESGQRFAVPGVWTPNTTILALMESAGPACFPGRSFEGASVRYVQKTIPFSKWPTTKLKSIGITQGGKTLLVVQFSKSPPIPSSDTTTSDVTMEDADGESQLNNALQILLKNNFDVDTKVCIVTLLKILDNILQQPANPKVRSIRVENAAFKKRVVSRKGGVDMLLACGFELQRAPPPLLSNAEVGEECLVLNQEKESTSFIVKARRLLMMCAINDLGMSADDLPKYKPPTRLVTADNGVSRKQQAMSRSKPPVNSSGEFNPYRGHRYDAKSAAVGENLGPDSNYVSSTEKQLQILQSQQAKLEQSMHRPLVDREISASLPNTRSSDLPTSSSSAGRADSEGARDGSLLASQLKRKEEERKRKEEGGLTTKAMRDLQQLKKQKVYSHAQLRIQFPDGSALEAKFLPKEKVQVVRDVILSCFVISEFDFDLYIAPPRRKLVLANTLEAEGLVPAAKVFVSWKVNAAPFKEAPVGSFLKPELFHGKQAAQAYPTAQSVLQKEKPAAAKKAAAKSQDGNKPSREDDMLRRMMGGNRGLGGGGQPRSSGGKGGGKPKWFKG